MNNMLKLGATLAALTLSASAFALPVTAVLNLKPRVSMEQLAENVTNPSSSHFNRFYTPEEIRSVAGPSAQEYKDLIAQLKAEGFTIKSESKTHLWITVQSDSEAFAQTFAARIQTVGENLHQNFAAVTVPNYLSLIETVSGLDNSRKLHPKYKLGHEVTAFGKKKGPGGIAMATIQTAYGFDAIYAAGVNGVGQEIAIATYDGFHEANANSYYKTMKITPAPVVDTVSFNGTAKFDPNSSVETDLDVEFSGMMAPGAKIHVFASAENSDAGEAAMFTAILDDNRAKVVNYSWGSCETGVDPAHATAMSTIYARAVAQGVNIMVASGDSGSDSCGDGTNAADFQSSFPYVVGVGGTTFAQASGKLAETAWEGSGGGISALWTLPDYQKDAKIGTKYKMRSYPDVSFNADPNSGQAIWTEQNGKGVWITIGGTSMAAPQWAGFMTLVNSARVADGKATLGFLNPLIYGMTKAEKTAAFHDVTSGSNGLYKAATGWDAVTGFGSMQADVLLNDLKAM